MLCLIHNKNTTHVSSFNEDIEPKQNGMNHKSNEYYE